MEPSSDATKGCYLPSCRDECSPVKHKEPRDVDSGCHEAGNQFFDTSAVRVGGELQFDRCVESSCLIKLTREPRRPQFAWQVDERADVRGGQVARAGEHLIGHHNARGARGKTDMRRGPDCIFGDGDFRPLCAVDSPLPTRAIDQDIDGLPDGECFLGQARHRQS